MKMNWYYRLMLSYTPIFFVVISSIIFVFFMVLNHASEKRYMETNQAILERMVFNTDANLKLIERNMVSQLLTDASIRTFFNDEPKTAFDYFEIQKKLTELKSSFPFSNSIYVYNEQEGRILSESGSYELESFGDKEFLLEQYERAAPDRWTNPRLFAYLSFDENRQKVVSLVKHYEDGGTKKGAAVVNVYVSSIVSYLNRISDSDDHAVYLLDTRQETFVDHAEESDASSTFVKSAYTGWEFYTDPVYERGYTALSYFSNVWLIFVVAVIVLALIGFTFVTHMHYKPIQSIMEKVDGFTAKKRDDLRLRNTNNEFAFIEMALDHLLKKSLDYDHLSKEDSMLRQQRLFYELLAGHESLKDEEWKSRMQSLDLPHAFERLGVAAVEIDRHADFVVRFQPRDQNLLKFVLENAFHELAQQHELFVWHAWMHPHQIAFVVHYNGDRQKDVPLRDLVEQFRGWIQQNLELTVTAGIGADSDTIETIADSYRSAAENVSLKTVFGTNTIIDNRSKAGMRAVDHYTCLRALESAARSFRMHENDWREKLTNLFADLKQMLFTRQDQTALLNSFTLQMEKVVSALSPDIERLWREEYRLRFEQMSENAETLDELYEQLMKLMYTFEAEVDEDRQARKHHSIAMQAKSYIDAHYADPDLSLARVSDILKLQQSALSQLFKQEMGEKFIDYVLKVRLHHARKLLLETSDPIPSIAEKVGYRNVISFYRVFKKVQQIPPGEYRNMHRNIEQEVDL